MTLLERIRQRLEAFGQSRDLTHVTKLFCEDLGWESRAASRNGDYNCPRPSPARYKQCP
jgi:hypothetical protein